LYPNHGCVGNEPAIATARKIGTTEAVILNRGACLEEAVGRQEGSSDGDTEDTHVQRRSDRLRNGSAGILQSMRFARLVEGCGVQKASDLTAQQTG
jgi:hypothetical protein